MLLRAVEIFKSFDEQPILRGVSVSAAEGEIVALLGPSGCGKTTLLRIIAGLETVDEGQLLLDEADLSSIPVHKRRFGMVFQDYALFPHKNVRENVGFGLKMLGWDLKSLNNRVEQVLLLVGLADFGDRAVHELSGGEQQRVAVARALAPYPRLLLLDEPLGSLDKALRERLMGDLRSILKTAADHETASAAEAESTSRAAIVSGSAEYPAGPGAAMTSLFVTHDQEEAFAIADRVLVMNKGRVEQEGTPVELYRNPGTPFVARFLGMENLLQVGLVPTEPPVVNSALGDFSVTGLAGSRSGRATMLIRPEAASLIDLDSTGFNTIVGRLVDVSFRGRHQVATVQVDGVAEPVILKFHFDSTVRLPMVSSKVKLRLDPAGLRLLEPEDLA
jgi:ABC-type Fe3+/spermidine/putrescine transport system ATPase subunit